MTKRIFSALLFLLVGAAASASAAPIITFTDGSGGGNPDENVLFNLPGLNLGPDTTIEGNTNNTDIIVTFTSDVNLIGTESGGQARVEAENTTAGYDNISVGLLDPNLFFREFKTNINIEAKTAGTATIKACDILNDCTTNVINVANGSNFFSILVTGTTLIDYVSIDTGAPPNATATAIIDLRQTRVTVAECPTGSTENCEDITIPEPSMMALLSLGLAGGLAKLRRRRVATR